MSRSVRVNFKYYLGDDAVTLDVTARVSAGYRDWWCNYVGAWMPGDPPEVEIESVTVNGDEFVIDDIAVRKRGTFDPKSPWEPLEDRLCEYAAEKADFSDPREYEREEI